VLVVSIIEIDPAHQVKVLTGAQAPSHGDLRAAGLAAAQFDYV
jgi:hypothetical protein